MQKPTLTLNDFEGMIDAVSNWGRWGKDDELGTLNLITPAKRLQAARVVKEGVSISLARNAIKTKVHDSPPFQHTMIQTGQRQDADSATDAYLTQYHGFTQTHIDALCHMFYKGRMFNGFSQQEVTEKGASRLSIINAKDGILTRGVLMDFPKLWGLKYLTGAKAIFPEDLDRWEEETKVKVETGDAVFIRTGHWARWEAEGEWNVESDSAGLHASSVPWFKKRDVAILASDLALDVMPSGAEGVRLPVHLLTLFAMGTPIIDNCDLESLSQAAASRNRREFLLTASPLPVEGGTGSPINPIATF